MINESKGIKRMILPLRARSMKNIFSTKKSPFVSMVKAKDKVGLPPIMGMTVIERKDINSKIGKRYRKWNLLDKFYKRKVDEQFWRKNINPLFEKKTSSMVNFFHYKDEGEKNEFSIENKEDALKKEEEDKKEKVVEEIKEKEVNDNKENREDKEVKEDKEIKSTSINEEDNNAIKKDEMKEVLEFIQDLDYDKYSRDMEIKETLQLLKNKIEKEHKEKDKENQSKDEGENLLCNNKDKKTNNEQGNKEEIDQIKEKIPVKEKNENSEQKEIKEIVNKEEENKKELIQKYKLAEKISKNEVNIILLNKYRN